MGRKIIIVSGVLAALLFVVGQVLERIHSPVADFVRVLCLPVVTIVFVIFLFAVRVRGAVFGGLRIAVLVGVVWLAVAVFWPRSYGSRPMRERAGTAYWRLPTGSRIAYWKIPAHRGKIPARKEMIPDTGVKKPFPIIYLQGGPGGAIDNGIIKMLTPLAEDGYDIYLYDQIGCGWSDRLANIRDYTADRHKRDLEAIVQVIGAPKVILIGQSWGAILATLFAADDPGRVAGMILTGPGPILPTHLELAKLTPPDSLHLHPPYYSNRQGNDLANNIRTRTMQFMAVQFGVKLASEKEADDFAAYLNDLVNRSTVYDTARINHALPGIGTGYYAQVMTVHSFRHTVDPRPKLRNSSIPVLVMKGQYDNQQWGFTHEYLELFPHAELVVFPDAGHCIFCDQPDAYLVAIRDFLKKGE